MKTILLVVVLSAGGWCAYSYFTTGHIALPGFLGRQGGEGGGLDSLSKRLARADADYRGANRAAGRAVDTSSEMAAAQREASAVLQEVRALKPQLKTAAERSSAEEIERRAQQLVDRGK